MSDLYNAWLEGSVNHPKKVNAALQVSRSNDLNWYGILVGRSMGRNIRPSEKYRRLERRAGGENSIDFCKLTKDDNDAQNYARLSNLCK